MFKGNLSATEPPLLAECTDLNQFINMLLAMNYPNHTQGVERAVKLTTAPQRLQSKYKDKNATLVKQSTLLLVEKAMDC